MRKYRYSVLIIVLVVLFSSCISDHKMDAGKKVALLMSAEDYSIGVEKKLSSEKRSGSWLSLRLVNIPLVLNNPPEKSTSFAAINFVSSLKKDEYEDIEGVKIILEGDSLTIEKEYSLKDIKIANSYFEIVKRFFKEFNTNKFFLVDTSYMPSEYILDLSTKATEMGLLNADNIIFSGFKFANLEINDKECVVVWADKKNAKELLRYSFTFLRENNKIIQISISD